MAVCSQKQRLPSLMTVYYGAFCITPGGGGTLSPAGKSEKLPTGELKSQR